MIFRPELARLILSGEKSMTRRRLPCRYRADRWYKVQPGRGEKHVCHIFLTKVRVERLRDISEQDAIREGFEGSTKFFVYWLKLVGEMRPRDFDERVAVIEWVVYPAVKDCCAKLEAA